MAKKQKKFKRWKKKIIVGKYKLSSFASCKKKNLFTRSSTKVSSSKISKMHFFVSKPRKTLHSSISLFDWSLTSLFNFWPPSNNLSFSFNFKEARFETSSLIRNWKSIPSPTLNIKRIILKLRWTTKLDEKTITSKLEWPTNQV